MENKETETNSNKYGSKLRDENEYSDLVLLTKFDITDQKRTTSVTL